MLQKKGVPGIVERTLIRPPGSQLGPISDAERQSILDASPMAEKYDKGIDRKSAFEILQARAQAAAKAAEQAESEDVLEAQTPIEREYSSARRYSGGRVGPILVSCTTPERHVRDGDDRRCYQGTEGHNRAPDCARHTGRSIPRQVRRRRP